MNTRTEQDNDITLYSLSELQAMKRRYDGNYKGWQPFTLDEVESEIIKRETPKSLIDIAAKWLKGNYSDTYIQSQMYAARNEITGIKHIVYAIKQAKEARF